MKQIPKWYENLKLFFTDDWTTSLVAKNPSISQEQPADIANDSATNTNFSKFSVDVFDQWWCEQPLNGHVIVTSGTTKEVMTVNTGGGDIVVNILHGLLKVSEGTVPTNQIKESNEHFYGG